MHFFVLSFARSFALPKAYNELNKKGSPGSAKMTCVINEAVAGYNHIGNEILAGACKSTLVGLKARGQRWSGRKSFGTGYLLHCYGGSVSGNAPSNADDVNIRSLLVLLFPASYKRADVESLFNNFDIFD